MDVSGFVPIPTPATAPRPAATSSTAPALTCASTSSINFGSIVTCWPSWWRLYSGDRPSAASTAASRSRGARRR